MSSSDSDEGAWPGGVWPLSLTIRDTEDLARFGLMVPPVSKVPGPWRIGADGVPTRGSPPTPEQLHAFPGARYNRKARRRFWRGKNFDVVLGAFRDAAADRPVGDITGEVGCSRRRRRQLPPAPGPSTRAQQAPPAPALSPLPPAQAALAQDGDPDDTPGLLAVLARSAAEAAAAAREEREMQAALAAVRAQEAQHGGNWWDDDSGDDGGEGGAGVVDLAGASDDE
ncbi:uncharacterized protein [Aegilops tauschii subsp. strangulata]|uniref:uncharacterized protein isoform X2 n=1 Tax=Aegilops tauschii subsp. strangulata TaxID=200361 RepID=UPI003CC8ABB4